ncbi:N-formylglutamate amidohydrolase [Nocardia crassostreae]|uniref:N-formylglutamate amidohydrolase n=1 Tax=Nocardia crassostreae TaxID=53428 RepID=UPI00082DF38D|nr:N-formylglutamate amidohydrolase [Nocardia crassostreae]
MTKHTHAPDPARPVPDNVELAPGAPESPVILHVPHSAREIPPAVRAGILLDDAALDAELDHITDAHTARLAAIAADRAECRPWQFVNRLSRLVVDPERFPDDREEMAAVGMGAVYTRTTQRIPLRPSDFDDAALLGRYFHPYARAMTDLVAARLAATGRAVVIDVHSYPTRRLPYELHGDGPRPSICLGVDEFHTAPELTALVGKIFAEFGVVGINSPFAGTYVPLDFYGKDPRVTAVMLEIRRDTYMTEPGGPAGPGHARLAAALGELIARIS